MTKTKKKLYKTHKKKIKKHIKNVTKKNYKKFKKTKKNRSKLFKKRGGSKEGEDYTGLKEDSASISTEAVASLQDEPLQIQQKFIDLVNQLKKRELYLIKNGKFFNAENDDVVIDLIKQINFLLQQNDIFLVEKKNNLDNDLVVLNPTTDVFLPSYMEQYLPEDSSKIIDFKSTIVIDLLSAIYYNISNEKLLIILTQVLFNTNNSVIEYINIFNFVSPLCVALKRGALSLTKFLIQLIDSQREKGLLVFDYVSKNYYPSNSEKNRSIIKNEFQKRYLSIFKALSRVHKTFTPTLASAVRNNFLTIIGNYMLPLGISTNSTITKINREIMSAKIEINTTEYIQDTIQSREEVIQSLKQSVTKNIPIHPMAPLSEPIEPVKTAREEEEELKRRAQEEAERKELQLAEEKARFELEKAKADLAAAELLAMEEQSKPQQIKGIQGKKTVQTQAEREEQSRRSREAAAAKKAAEEAIKVAEKEAKRLKAEEERRAAEIRKEESSKMIPLQQSEIETPEQKLAREEAKKQREREKKALKKAAKLGALAVENGVPPEIIVLPHSISKTPRFFNEFWRTFFDIRELYKIKNIINYLMNTSLDDTQENICTRIKKKYKSYFTSTDPSEETNIYNIMSCAIFIIFGMLSNKFKKKPEFKYNIIIKGGKAIQLAFGDVFIPYPSEDIDILILPKFNQSNDGYEVVEGYFNYQDMYGISYNIINLIVWIITPPNPEETDIDSAGFVTLNSSFGGKIIPQMSVKGAKLMNTFVSKINFSASTGVVSISDIDVKPIDVELITEPEKRFLTASGFYTGDQSSKDFFIGNTEQTDFNFEGILPLSFNYQTLHIALQEKIYIYVKYLLLNQMRASSSYSFFLKKFKKSINILLDYFLLINGNDEHRNFELFQKMIRDNGFFSLFHNPDNFQNYFSQGNHSLEGRVRELYDKIRQPET